MTFRHSLIAGLALATIASASAPASAADTFGIVGGERSWNGCYVGAHLGGSWGRGTSTDLPFVEGPQAGSGVAWNSLGPTYEAIGFGTDGSLLGGGEVGCDTEIMLGGMRFVVGGVVDLSATGNSGLQQSAIFSDTNVAYSADWLGSLRARAGVATPDVLLFATGGLAIGGIDVRAFDTVGIPTAGMMDVSGGGTEYGWVAGGGAELRVSDRWSVSLEYLHHQFDGIVATGRASVPTTAFPRFENDLSFDTVRVGIKFRL